MSASERLITLKGGCVVPVSVLRRMWMLEDCGLHFKVEGTDGLLVGPPDLLTDEDRFFIREHRALVSAVVRYCALEVRV